MREHDSEPVTGLPEELPEGERLLWQGTPTWKGLVLHVMHVRGVAIYFAILFAYFAATAASQGTPVGEALAIGARGVPVALASLGLLGLVAWLIRRSTVYTITSRRLVMRFGVALPVTINIPFGLIEAADLKLRRDGSGDIPLAVGGKDRMSFVVLWPNVRPWHTTKPQPMLRSVPEAREVAETLGRALEAFNRAAGVATVRTPAIAPPEAAAAGIGPAHEPAAA